MKNIPSILHCKTCSQISSKIDFEDSPCPRGIGKFITIYTESIQERLTDETKNLKKCPDCFSYYYFYFHEEREDTIEPIIRHFLERVNFTKLHSIFNKIISHKKNEKNIFMSNYPLIINEYIKIVQLLLDFEVDVNLVDRSACRYTALMHAVLKNSLELVKLLLKNGAKTHLRASKGWVYSRNALMLAVKKGNIEIVKLLLYKMIKRKEKIDEADSEGKTVLNLTRNKNILKLLNEILNKVQPKTKRESKFLQLVRKAGLYKSEGNKYIPQLIGLLSVRGFKEKDVQILKEFILKKRIFKNIILDQLKALKTKAKNDLLDSLIWISQNTEFKTETKNEIKKKIRDFLKYRIPEKRPVNVILVKSIKNIKAK